MQPCPFCGRNRVVELSEKFFRCDHCDALFDDDPDEGGDYSGRDPAARMIREERAKARARAHKRW